MDTLVCDPQAREDGLDHQPRQVFSGHYVLVSPTPIQNPVYIAHSSELFKELGFADELARSRDFIQLFSADLSALPRPMHKIGWSCGYALSIFGTEYYQQCPFNTGNGYGDGRAISVLELVTKGQRWEMQLKGGGRTPYCRGADGRAVLRSSVREFLAQEHMHALGVSTSRSLSLLVSETETVKRPWYSEGSHSRDPDMLVDEPVAISTRVAPSFLRVGQIELFGRRARKQEHPDAMQELEKIVLHVIEREYADEIDSQLVISEKVLLLARLFRDRLASLVTQWLRVGYCQGNFNSDNCPVGGFTLDYGPFGFMEAFDPYFQPWTGGGQHFSFWYQPTAAMKNFEMFITALKPLLTENSNITQGDTTGAMPDAIKALDDIKQGFETVIQQKMENMWAGKMGLPRFDVSLFSELITLMQETSVDFTLFFRELSGLPELLEPLKKSFYGAIDDNLQERWKNWLKKWHQVLQQQYDGQIDKEQVSKKMKQLNPKYVLREWMLAPAYQQAKSGNYELIAKIQAVMAKPYAEQSKQVEAEYYRLRPSQLNDVGGVSHMSCSS